MHAVGLFLCIATSTYTARCGQTRYIAHVQGSWLHHAHVSNGFCYEKQPAFPAAFSVRLQSIIHM